jgi:hypothetical protein
VTAAGSQAGERCSLPGEEGGAGRWALDQAALDACLAALRWLVAELRDATPPQLDTR